MTQKPKIVGLLESRASSTKIFDTEIATPTVFELQASNFYTILTNLLGRDSKRGFLNFCLLDFLWIFICKKTGVFGTWPTANI